MIDNKKLWTDALIEIEMSVSKANFGTWFKNTKIVKYDSGAVSLGVPNAFVRDWLVNKYHKDILRALRNLSGEVRSLEYLIVKTEDADKAPKNTPQNKPV